MKLLAAMLKEQFLGKLPGNFPSLIPPIDRRTGFIVHSKLALTFCGRWPPRRGRLQALTLSEWCVCSEKRASVVFIANPWAYALVSRAQGHGGELIKAFFPARPPTHSPSRPQLSPRVPWNMPPNMHEKRKQYFAARTPRQIVWWTS